MGGCVSRSGREPSASIASSDQIGNTTGNVTIGKNKPLNPDKPKWKSEIPLTLGQLRSKRDEFWETAPAFEGRREIWDALRAACETDDVTLAQAIVDGANISLPTGSLSDAYDELGNHYVIPVYCVSPPSNLIQNEDISTVSAGSKESIKDESALGEETMIRLRLSTSNQDAKWNVHSGETILSIKRRINKEFDIVPGRQRFFFSGKMLYDKMTVGDAKIPKGYVVQVIVAPEAT